MFIRNNVVLQFFLNLEEKLYSMIRGGIFEKANLQSSYDR